MRIDALQAAATAAETAISDSSHHSAETKDVPASPPPTSNAEPAADAKSRELSVSVSFVENQVIVYRFVDKDTGDLIQQVPPEEVLEVMRGIDEMLNEENIAHQKIDIRS